MGRKLAQEEFIRKVNEKNEHVKNGDVEIRGQYVNYKTLVECYCTKHDVEWSTQPAALYQGCGCRLCATEQASQRYMAPYEDFIKKLYETNEHFRRGEFKVTGTYKGANKQIECYCNIHLKSWMPIPSNLYKGYGCPLCGKKQQQISRRTPYDVFVTKVFESNEHIKSGDIEIRGVYDGIDTPIECYCNIHNVAFYPTPYALENGSGCPYCAGHKVLAGFNDLWTTNPDVAKLLTNPNDGYLVAQMSHAKKNFTCPLCGTKQDKIVMNVTRRGLRCSYCSCHISYPNRFSRALFSQLPVENYIPEYHPEWLLPYSFDNYFEYNGQCFVVENDAGIGHGNKQWGPGNKPDVEGKKRDELKDKLAAEHNVHVIRVDTQVSTCEYIKQHMLESELAKILDLSNVDWEKCDMDAQNNLVKIVCDLYMTTTTDLQGIADIVQLGTQCIRNYLKRGANFGWCNYDPAFAIRTRKTNNKKRKIIITRISTEEEFVFESVKDCARYLPAMFGVKISYSMLYRYAQDGQSHKGFLFKIID